jgi:hypothetical protein
MRMARLELAGDRGGDVGEGELAGFLRDPGVEHHLEQQVAKLLAQAFDIAAGDRVGDLVGFLDRVRGDRRKVLRPVPFASAHRIAQPGHHRQQSRERSRRGFAGCAGCAGWIVDGRKQISIRAGGTHVHALLLN